MKKWIENLGYVVGLMLGVAGIVIVLCVAVLAVVGTYASVVKLLGG